MEERRKIIQELINKIKNMPNPYSIKVKDNLTLEERCKILQEKLKEDYIQIERLCFQWGEYVYKIALKNVVELLKDELEN